MAQEEIKYWKKKYRLTYAIWFFTALTLIGLTMNFVVIVNNDCKMPVDMEYLPNQYSETHFLYQNTTDINYSFLADNHKVGRGRLSLGDFFMFFGLLFIIILNIIVGVYDYKYEKHQNNVLTHS